MNLCDITTCEQIARLYLPTIRAELVYRLVENRGVPQTKVASSMGLSRAAVSQYLSKKRGGTPLNINDDLDRMLELWAQGIVAGKFNVTICDICHCVCRNKPISE